MTSIRPNSAPSPLAPPDASQGRGAARSGTAESESSAYEEFLSIFQDLLSGDGQDDPAREVAVPGSDVLALHPIVPIVTVASSSEAPEEASSGDSELGELSHDTRQELPGSTGEDVDPFTDSGVEKVELTKGSTVEASSDDEGAPNGNLPAVVEGGEHGVTSNVAQAALAVEDLTEVITLLNTETSRQSQSAQDGGAAPSSSEPTGTSAPVAAEVPVDALPVPVAHTDTPDVPNGDLAPNRAKSDTVIAASTVDIPTDLDALLFGASSDANRDTPRTGTRGKEGGELPLAAAPAPKVNRTIPDLPIENSNAQSALFLRHAFEGGASLASLTQRGGTEGANRQILPGASLSRQVRGVEGAQRSSNTTPRTSPVLAMQRIADAAQEGVRQGHRSLSVQLDPPALGTVTVTVSMTDRGVHTRIIPEQSQTTQLIREHAPELQQMIRRQLGISIHDVTVSVSDGGGSFEQFATTSDGSSSGWSNEQRGDTPSSDLTHDEFASPSSSPSRSVDKAGGRSTEDSWIA